jgi:hypothetical protein
MTDIKDLQNQLQQEARDLLSSTSILEKLNTLGRVTQTGSSVTNLMVYPDIDFAVQNNQLDFDSAVQLVPDIISDLKATAVKIADFRTESDPKAGYYIGFELPYRNRTWHIDATVGGEGVITTNPPELAEWIAEMTEDERETILELKKELIDSKRYVGARSQPPYTFRSSHLYEGVLLGKAKSITALEEYFTQTSSSI